MPALRLTLAYYTHTYTHIPRRAHSSLAHSRVQLDAPRHARERRRRPRAAPGGELATHEHPAARHEPPQLAAPVVVHEQPAAVSETAASETKKKNKKNKKKAKKNKKKLGLSIKPRSDSVSSGVACRMRKV